MVSVTLVHTTLMCSSWVLMLTNQGKTTCLRAEPCSPLGGQPYGRKVHVLTLLPSHYGTDSGSKLHCQHKRVPLTSISDVLSLSLNSGRKWRCPIHHYLCPRVEQSGWFNLVGANMCFVFRFQETVCEAFGAECFRSCVFPELPTNVFGENLT